MARSTLIGIVVAALGAGAWWWSAAIPGAPAAGVPGSSTAHHPGTPSTPSLRASAGATAVPAVAAVAAGTSPAAASPPPPGLTPAQWALVLADLQGRPDPSAERQRLEAYFGWSDTVRRWREQRDDATLAAEVDAGLPDRLARREVSAGEGRQLKAALLLTLEPDPDRRTAEIQIRIALMNRFSALGAAEIVRVA